MLAVHHIWTAEFHCVAHSNFHKTKASCIYKCPDNETQQKWNPPLDKSSSIQYTYKCESYMYSVYFFLYLRVTMLNCKKSYKIIVEQNNLWV
jgi:hypothetical protein